MVKEFSIAFNSRNILIFSKMNHLKRSYSMKKNYIQLQTHPPIHNAVEGRNDDILLSVLSSQCHISVPNITVSIDIEVKCHPAFLIDA